MAAIGKVFRKNDEMYTPPILVQPIIKHVVKWSENFLKKYNTCPIILCPFDTEDSEFVRGLCKTYFSSGWFVEHGHIITGQDFFTHNYGKWDICISNPPFSLKKKIYEKLFELDKPFALLGNLMQINYEEIGRLFADNPIQILSFDRRVSFDGNPSSFMSGYICKDFLEKDLIFEKLEHNNVGSKCVKSAVYNNLIEN